MSSRSANPRSSRVDLPDTERQAATGGRRSFNPWPYSIVGFFSLMIVAAVVWVVFCISHGTDLVAADYYEQEIEYQQQLDRMARVRELSGPAQVSYEPAGDFILVQVPPAHAASQVSGVIHLYRPSQASLDQILPLEVTQAGEQRLKTETLAAGVWNVRLQWTAAGKEYFLEEKVFIQRHGT